MPLGDARNVDGDAVAAIDTHARTTSRIAAEATVAAVGFADQVWI